MNLHKLFLTFGLKQTDENWWYFKNKKDFIILPIISILGNQDKLISKMLKKLMRDRK